ncbi:hypothetical protein D0Z07_8651 [Hyphodiscus hymeniophilus]|uniref:Integral membrane protein n=1 Tax=Hyphodiscus hymeniophilus TaxID=353542 RepID=A0A9P6VE25_9HELO|nr:hypothetical protein D0Z07_8651 [Hyphodiscus hymeniophilus]
MAQPGMSQPPPSSFTKDENPVRAVGRKLKSVLSSDQQSSVRIRRGPSTTEGSRRLPVTEGVAEKPSQGNVPASRFAAIRSLFTREDHNTQNDYFDTNDSDTDLLDVVDPEVATLATLTNVQNSLFVPQLGRFVNRRPTYRVSERPGEERAIGKLKAKLRRLASLEGEPLSQTKTPTPRLIKLDYAVLPDYEGLEGWTPAEEAELDDMVRHQLHSRRAKFKRAMKGFGQYVRRPFGLFITVYATLITLFGAAWVLFLIGWISLGSRESYVINIVDNVLVALFAIIGDGLAPFRAVDTYHMIYIAHYHRLSWKKRERLGLPDLADHNDLPEQRKEDIEPAEVDLESLIAKRLPRSMARRLVPRIPNRLAQRMVTRSGTIEEPSYDYSVLTEDQQAKLEFHERKFSKSHTFYKPHETETHFAFPLKLLVAVVLLLDCHSMLQISLGACTWGISYKKRPFALTTVILCCSITCNILGGVLISIGDKRTRKKDVIERMMKQELTEEAIDKLNTRRMKEAEERGDIHPSVRKQLEEQKERAEDEEVKKAWASVPSLPKKLLGKGEDHRQPSLPQKARGSRAGIPSTASNPSTPNSRTGTALPPVQEASALPAHPEPVLAKGNEPPKEGTGQKVMRFIRRADLDKS